MLPPDLAHLGAVHRVRQQTIAARVLRAVLRLWAALGSPDQWPLLAPRVRAAVTAGQMAAATGATEYVSAALMMQHVEPDPAGPVSPRALAGVASDGRDLAGLLDYPAFEADALINGGMPTDRALAVGRRHLGRIVVTQMQDAARVATGVAIAVDRSTAGYVRLATAPCCSRCAVLAGRWYRWSAGFARHPQCDCVSVPAASHIEPASPRAVYDSMDPAQRAKAGWSAADQRAIADGADIYQVTNARRGMRSLSIAGRSVSTTTEGTTRRGLAGQRLGTRKGHPVLRLTPEQIYAEAGDDRDEVIRLLRRHGYIL